MMKKGQILYLYLILVTLLVVTLSCSDDNGHSTLPQTQIRTATAMTIPLEEVDGEFIEKDPDPIQVVVVYDRYGDQIGIYSFNSHEEEWQIETDSDGNVTELIILHYNGADPYISTQVLFKYDTDGHLIEMVTNTPRQVPYKWKQTMSYNEDGTLIEIYSYNENDEFQARIVHDYDTEGNDIQEIFYDSSGIPYQKREREYDDAGNTIREDSYFDRANTGSLELEGTITHQYDHDRNILERTSYNSEGSVQLQTTYTYLEYDEYGNWISRQVDQLKYIRAITVSTHERTHMTYTYYHEVGIFA